MTTEDIFLGSQASLTMIPEVDLYIQWTIAIVQEAEIMPQIQTQ